MGSKRGMGSASPETRLRVARSGGNALHRIRGLQGASEETRRRVAALGGQSVTGIRKRRNPPRDNDGSEYPEQY